MIPHHKFYSNKLRLYPFKIGVLRNVFNVMFILGHGGVMFGVKNRLKKRSYEGGINQGAGLDIKRH